MTGSEVLVYISAAITWGLVGLLVGLMFGNSDRRER